MSHVYRKCILVDIGCVERKDFAVESPVVSIYRNYQIDLLMRLHELLSLNDAPQGLSVARSKWLAKFDRSKSGADI